MRRLFSFLMGFLIGGAISAVIVFLVTPEGKRSIRDMYQEAYRSRKAELEDQLQLKPD